MANELIEIGGTPPLEGKEGFYGSYLHFLQNVIAANLKVDTIENNKLVIINLIEIGIAMIPDPPNKKTGEAGKTRDDIYKKINEYYNEIYDAAEADKGKLSADEERNLLYKAYVRKGIGSMSTWYDQVTGIVTKNIVARTGPGKR